MTRAMAILSFEHQRVDDELAHLAPAADAGAIVEILAQVQEPAWALELGERHRAQDRQRCLRRSLRPARSIRPTRRHRPRPTPRSGSTCPWGSPDWSRSLAAASGWRSPNSATSGACDVTASGRAAAGRFRPAPACRTDRRHRPQSTSGWPSPRPAPAWTASSGVPVPARPPLASVSGAVSWLAMVSTASTCRRSAGPNPVAGPR